MTSARGEVWFRRVLIAFSVTAALMLLSNVAVLFWAQNEFSGPESVVAAQATMLAQSGTLYYDINKYPYTICAYTPVLYLLEAGLSKVGLSTMTAGRLLSLVALLGILIVIWRLLVLYTGDRYCAWTGVLLCASTANLVFWGTVGQVDTLAVFCALAAFYQYSRYSIRGEATLIWAGILAVLSLFTKQTMIACPAAIFVLLWFQHRKVAVRFAAGFAATVLIIVLVIDTWLNGRFLANTVLANLNPFAIEKFNQHLRYLLIAAGQLIIVAVAGARQARRGGGVALFVYLGIAALVLTVTAAKVGSDLNYQIESTIALILCACVALHALDFFSLSFRGSKAWVTLLQIPLAVHLFVNFRAAGENVLTRISNEQEFRTQVAALRPYLSDGRRLLSTDYNSMARLRGSIEVEPLIYKLLVGAGVVNPEPLRLDLAAEAFATVLLSEDVFHREHEPAAEIATLPALQIAEIQKHYKLEAHVRGPYLNGLYVYKPLARGAE
jgi:4-amino-4-deoxy-L-arabinose transferase-like glycosyltransferase